MKTSKTVAFSTETESDLYSYANSIVNFSEYVKSKLKEDLQKLDEAPTYKRCIICNMQNTTLKRTCSAECYEVHRKQLYKEADERKKLNPNFRKKRTEIELKSKARSKS
ncbi:MAG: hypothetical protein RSA09_03240 [Acinetobacter sp.]